MQNIHTLSILLKQNAHKKRGNYYGVSAENCSMIMMVKMTMIMMMVKMTMIMMMMTCRAFSIHGLKAQSSCRRYIQQNLVKEREKNYEKLFKIMIKITTTSCMLVILQEVVYMPSCKISAAKRFYFKCRLF